MDKIEKEVLSSGRLAAPSSLARVLDQAIRAIDIPPRPQIIDRIRAEMVKEVPCLRRVGQLINADVGLAASLLKTANSPYFGLFRDCGIVILLRRYPDHMQTLARANGDVGRPFTAVEQLDYPTDHAVVGSLLAGEWWLPDEIIQAIRHHHDQSAIDLAESDLPLAGRRMIALSQTAEHMLQSLTGASRTEEWPKLGASCLRLLALDEETLGALFVDAAAIIEATDCSR